MHNPSAFRGQQGFTLLEILVVTAIILIATSMTVFQFQRGSGLAEAADKLVLQLDTARDEAMAKGRLIGFSSDGAAYQFWWQNERQEWEPLSSEGLRNTRLPEGVQIAGYRVNQQNRPLGERVLLPSDGVIEPFEIELRAGSDSLRISGDVMGRIGVASAAAVAEP
ncbi:GspH/FimT family pseudopilin [Chitinibacter tainanensis]|uniref:GspH/FimT family pseudopilin n=1 Tax=Chitinibacter tainanensis TaxID=230667 RepID=UPI000407DCBB|nr:GspH/FimT family pseudopilin [Chitinibacter tainanensis]